MEECYLAFPVTAHIPRNIYSVGGKSKRHNSDIRQHYIDLEKRKARKYPVSDLIPARTTIGQWLGKTS